MLVLGLESSCDDCSAAVVRETPEGPVLVAMTRKSQDEIHGPYGGVVPELAAREHLLQLRGVVAGALEKAGVALKDLDRIAVTQGPGLVGSLLTTFSASKAMAWREGIPWVGVHHLLGHLNAARFAVPDLPFPALALLVSGGHTHLYLARDWTHLELLQKTRDDAAGEAFDKTARMLNLGYPGGPIVDTCGRSSERSAAPFTPPKFRDGKAGWSFSGLKTAVKMRIHGEPGLEAAGAGDPRVKALCRTLQETVASWLLKPMAAFRDETGARSLIVSGGVACNSELRAQAAAVAQKLGLVLAIPEPRFCTDNGAMIAAAGAMLEPSAEYRCLNADPNLPLNPEPGAQPWK
jgi:N6-L-threonylcarbamoyladenine synthase